MEIKKVIDRLKDMFTKTCNSTLLLFLTMQIFSKILQNNEVKIKRIMPRIKLVSFVRLGVSYNGRYKSTNPRGIEFVHKIYLDIHP